MLKKAGLITIAGRLFTSYGYYLVIPFLIIYITRYLGMSAAEAGILVAILNLSRRGLAILAGFWNDKFGARNMMMVGLGLEFIAYLTMGLTASFFMLALIMLLSGAGGCFYNISSRSILAQNKSSHQTALGFGLFYVTMHIGALLGPLTYLYFVKNKMINFSFLVSAGLYLVFLLATIIWIKDEKKEKTAQPPKLLDIKNAFISTEFTTYFILMTGVWFVVNQLYVILPLYIANLNHGVQLIAYLNAWNAILVIVIQYGCSWWVGKLSHVQRLNILSAGILVMGAGWFLFSFHGNLAIYGGMTLFTLGEILFIGVVDLLAVTFAPAGQSGLYLGFSTFSWAIGGALAGLFGGYSYEMFSKTNHLYLLWSCIFLIAVVLSMAILFYKQKLHMRMMQTAEVT